MFLLVVSAILLKILLTQMISADGVPKEELKCKDVLARIASVMLVQKKVSLHTGIL